MGKQYDNTNRGYAVKNARHAEGDNRPKYAGKQNADGKDNWLSIWVGQDNNGDPKLTTSLTPIDQKASGKPPAKKQEEDDFI